MQFGYAQKDANRDELLLIVTGTRGMHSLWGAPRRLVTRFEAKYKNRLGDISSSLTDAIRPSEYNTLGNFATEKGKLLLARRCYRRAVELESYDQNTPYNLGISYFQAEQYEKAIVELSK